MAMPTALQLLMHLVEHHPTVTFGMLMLRNQTNQVASNLVAGTYSITIIDNASCETVSSVVVSEPPTLSSNATSTSTQCNGEANGSISVTASGGTGSYTYDIGSGFQASQNFNGLAAGTYAITVSDANRLL